MILRPRAKEEMMTEQFREIPLEAFGTKPVIRIRDIDAVTENYRLFRDKADETGSACGVVVKADVHGLGLRDVAPALYEAGARVFFVEELFEALELKEILQGNDSDVYVLGGLLQGEAAWFLDNGITPCVNSLEQLETWNRVSEGRNRHVIIHLDTRMNRLGLTRDEVVKLSGNLDHYAGNLTVDYYMSHFFDIKGDDHSNCQMQIRVLREFLALLPPAPVTMACTDSMILLDTHEVNFDLVRPGIGLVGGAPSAGRPISASAPHCLEIYAKHSQPKWIPKGETVGYGGAFRAARDTRIALVHIGYKDGYLRQLSGLDPEPEKGAYMSIRGYRVPVIGKISLGASTVDVTDVPDAILRTCPYMEVVGPNVDIRVLADKVGCYEIMMALGRPNRKMADYRMDEFLKAYG